MRIFTFYRSNTAQPDFHSKNDSEFGNRFSTGERGLEFQYTCAVLREYEQVGIIIILRNNRIKDEIFGRGGRQV